MELTEMSFKAEMQTDSSGVWRDSGMRFATAQEAQDNVDDLIRNMRWVEVRGLRVIECSDPVNYSYRDHELRREPPSNAPLHLGITLSEGQEIEIP
jgi:hypothetical protein